MPRVTVYTTTICPYCVKAKSLLKRKSIDFEEINLARQPDLRMELSARTGMRTVPMIFIDDDCIGGCDELYALEAAGELDRRLAPGEAPG